MFPKAWYNGQPRKQDGFMVDGYSQMVGGARMRLVRIKRGKFVTRNVTQGSLTKI